MPAASSSKRWPSLIAIAALALLAVACSSHRRPPGAATSAPVNAPATNAPQGARPLAVAQSALPATASPPQQPADHPLVVAMQPDLPPRGAGLVPTPVGTPGDAAQSFAQGRSLNLPPGFEASVYAVTGGEPRLLALGPDGRLFVTLTGAGQVAELVPDSSGAYAAPRVIIRNLDAPHGITFFAGYMYIAETDQVDRFPYDGTVDIAHEEVVVPNLPAGGHFTRTVGFGPDGRMYVSVGSSCNVCIESNPLRAAISVYNADGSDGAVYASGLRNAVGFVRQPGTGDLWATVNGRDDIGTDMGLNGAAARQTTDNLPPDYVTRISAGGDYGWPRCYGDHELDPLFGDSAFCASTLAPSVELQAHSAPLGLAFYTGDVFPSEYQGDLLVALHGSWDRSVPTGYKLVRVKFENGAPVRAEDFATGWNAGGQAWGRPVDVLVLPDGSLLVTDDSAGVIYRITYTAS